MASGEKKLTLQQTRDVLLAAIDYLLEYKSGQVKFDQVDPRENYYRKLKEKTEKDYQKGKSKSIERWLIDIIGVRKMSGDLNFIKYIKEKTGLDIHIFDNLPERINKIIQQKKIKNNAEYQDVMAMGSIWHQTPGDRQQMDKLQQLRTAFQDRLDKRQSKQKLNYFSNLLYHSCSPDNTSVFHVCESGLSVDNSSTSVSVGIIGVGGGGIYTANGINLGIKAYWKNNNTIVIEEKKGTPVNTQWNELQVFDHVITVEYIEY